MTSSQKSIIVFGPAGCGKTRDADLMLRALGLDYVVEFDAMTDNRKKMQRSLTGVLYLTNLTYDQLVHDGYILETDRRVMSYDHAMTEVRRLQRLHKSPIEQRAFSGRRPQLRIKKLHPDAILPRYWSQGAAAFDLHAAHDRTLLSEPHTFSTGLAIEVPEGYVGYIHSRSGHGFKSDVRLANCVGVIDSDYRGEINVRLTPDNFQGQGAFIVKTGDRIAQFVLHKVEQWDIIEVEELSSTERGNNGYGSTGR